MAVNAAAEQKPEITGADMRSTMKPTHKYNMMMDSLMNKVRESTLFGEKRESAGEGSSK